MKFLRLFLETIQFALSIRNVIKRAVLGTDLSQEYLCIEKENFLRPLRVFLADGVSLSTTDISDRHLFLGYKPLIIGFPVPKESEWFGYFSSHKDVSLFFSSDSERKNPVAELKLQLHSTEDFEQYTIFLFTGINGKHQFLSGFHQRTNTIRNKLRGNKENNLALIGNLYDQVRIAYALPRRISIVSLGNGEQFNFFPSDLHGSLSDNTYVISLRHQGRASQQVSELKKVCISSVNASSYKKTYHLGKNHMQPLKPIEAFEVFSERSEQLKLPLPLSVVAYHELEWMKSIDIGIHRLHFFRILNHKILRSDSPSLAHIHNFYAMWRSNQGFETNYLLR